MFQNDFDVADHGKRLKYITGYTGRNGVAVVTKTKLAFWIDELHYEQADNELSCNWTLFKAADMSAVRITYSSFLKFELSVPTTNNHLAQSYTVYAFV